MDRAAVSYTASRRFESAQAGRVFTLWQGSGWNPRVQSLTAAPDLKTPLPVRWLRILHIRDANSAAADWISGEHN